MERPIFIEFTKLNGSMILINANAISTIEEINYSDGTVVKIICNNKIETHVKESISDIENLLNRFTSCL